VPIQKTNRVLDETIVPPAACERRSETLEFDEEPVKCEHVDRLLAPLSRRVVHFALRIGKNFEIVVECCHV